MLRDLKETEMRIHTDLEKAGYLRVREVLENFLRKYLGHLGDGNKKVVLDYEGQQYQLMIGVDLKKVDPKRRIDVRFQDMAIDVILVGPFGREETIHVPAVRELMNRDVLLLQATNDPYKEMVTRLEEVISRVEAGSFRFLE